MQTGAEGTDPPPRVACSTLPPPWRGVAPRASGPRLGELIKRTCKHIRLIKPGTRPSALSLQCWTTRPSAFHPAPRLCDSVCESWCIVCGTLCRPAAPPLRRSERPQPTTGGACTCRRGKHLLAPRVRASAATCCRQPGDGNRRRHTSDSGALACDTCAWDMVPKRLVCMRHAVWGGGCLAAGRLGSTLKDPLLCTGCTKPRFATAVG